jgi:hypothetical protein
LFQNVGAGTVTITPTTSTINGAATAVLTTGTWVSIASDGTNYVGPAGGGNASTSGTLAQFAATTSAQLAGVLNDETGSGAAVFANTPTLIAPVLGTPGSGNLANCNGLVESGLTLADNTTNNTSTTKHGFAPKLPNDATKYLDGTGAYTVPAGGGGGFIPTDYIAGCLITKGTGNTINISAGKYYDPNTAAVVTFSAVTDGNAGTLGASQWHQVYLIDGTTFEVANNASPPSTAYLGSARKGGTGGERRWIGSFESDGSSNIIAMVPVETGSGGVRVQRPQNSPLSSGTATSYTSVSLTSAVPRYVTTSACLDVSFGYSTTPANDLQVQISPDGGTTDSFRARLYISGTTTNQRVTCWTTIDAASPQLHYKLTVIGGGVGPNLGINVMGFTFSR